MENNDLDILIKEEFPFRTPYNGQLETIKRICQAFINGKIHVVLDAPTGSGKSVIAYTVMKVLTKLAEIRRTTIITTTKSLQDTYTKTFDELVLLKSKTNYKCPFNAGPYNSFSCKEIINLYNCDAKINCPYVKARTFWCDHARYRNTNTAFMLKACSMLVTEPGRFSDFMIIDECHKLEELIIDNSEFIISDKALISLLANSEITDSNIAIGLIEKLVNHFRILSGNFSVDLISSDFTTKSLSEEIAVSLNQLLEQIDTIIERLSLEGAKVKSIKKFVTIKDDLGDLANSFSLLSKVEDKSRMLINQLVDKNDLLTGEISVKVIDAKATSNWSLFRKSSKFLHMSGTVCGFDYYVSKLGIPREQCEFISLNNPIPKERRIIHAMNKFRIKSNDFNSNVGSILVADKIIEHYKDQHGFIYCPSYEMCELYVNHSRHKGRLILVNDINEAIKIMSQPNNKVIVSAGIVEGIDLKNDMCRFQIIPRIPYLYLGDPVIKVKLDTEPEYYFKNTIMKLVQVCGRGVRGPEDYCHTFIFDNSLRWLLSNNKEYVPKWFNESIKYY